MLSETGQTQKDKSSYEGPSVVNPRQKVDVRARGWGCGRGVSV